MFEVLELIQLGRMGSGEFETTRIFVTILMHGFVMSVNIGDESVTKNTSVSVSKVDCLDVS